MPYEQHCRADEQCQPNLEVMVTPGATLLLGGHTANMTMVLMLCNCGKNMHGASGTTWGWHSTEPGPPQCRHLSHAPQYPPCVYPCPSVSTLPSVPLLSPQCPQCPFAKSPQHPPPCSHIPIISLSMSSRPTVPQSSLPFMSPQGLQCSLTPPCPHMVLGCPCRCHWR